MEELMQVVFSKWSAPRLCHATNQVQLVSAVQGSEELVGELVS
jgi:hypothetical protein